MRKTLTSSGVAALKPRAARYAFSDPELRGHLIRIQPSGAKSYVAVTRDPAGKQVWATIGPVDLMDIDEAREKAREAIKRIQAGKPAFEAAVKAETFGDVAATWLKRHVKAKGLRSEVELTRLLNTHILPIWKDDPFSDIGRRAVAELLDEVEDDHGARQADYVLAIVRGIMNFHAARANDYSPPLIAGMRRRNPKERERSRVLDDNELRALWAATEGHGDGRDTLGAALGAFGGFVRLLLWTGQRRDRLGSMRWADVSPDGVWTIHTDSREKGAGGELRLPPAAFAIVQAQPRLGDNPFVFAAARIGKDGAHARMSGWSKRKRALDARILASMRKADPHAKPILQWQLHDLRRTARSLMSRARVPGEHAERVLGHVRGGVEGVYDRHQYSVEKADALLKLAALIDAIVHPRPAEVVPLARKRPRQ
jgi:integrase